MLITTLSALGLLLFWFSTADAETVKYRVSTLQKGETVSHKALQLTRDASNWPKAVVRDPRTQRVYGYREYRRLPVGTEVHFPENIVLTEARTLVNESVLSLCEKFTNPNCAREVAKINNLNPGARVSRTVYVPAGYEARAVQAPAAPPTQAPAAEAPKQETGPAAPAPGFRLWEILSWKRVGLALLIALVILAVVLVVGLLHLRGRRDEDRGPILRDTSWLRTPSFMHRAEQKKDILAWGERVKNELARRHPRLSVSVQPNLQWPGVKILVINFEDPVRSPLGHEEFDRSLRDAIAAVPDKPLYLAGQELTVTIQEKQGSAREVAVTKTA